MVAVRIGDGDFGAGAASVRQGRSGLGRARARAMEFGQRSFDRARARLDNSCELGSRWAVVELGCFVVSLAKAKVGLLNWLKAGACGFGIVVDLVMVLFRC